MRREKGLPPNTVVDRIRGSNRSSGVSERNLGFYLLDFDERRLYLDFGCSSTAAFAQNKIQVHPRKTRELLRIARALEELPLVDRAFDEELVFWSAVREITRVATCQTEREWLALAQKSSLRAVEAAVSRAGQGEPPPREPFGPSQSVHRVIAELAPARYALWEAACRRIGETQGSGLNSSQVLFQLLESFMARPLAAAEEEKRQFYQVVYHRCPDCHQAWMNGEGGAREIDLSEVQEEKTEVLHLGEGDPRGSRELANQPTPPWLREQVLARDEHVCMVPGCSHRMGLTAHHIKPRSQGGKTVLENLVTTCPRCHGLLHERKLVVVGRAPYELRWWGPLEAYQPRSA